MEDDFAHHEHHRQPHRVKHCLPRAAFGRDRIEHHHAHAAEEIRQRHHQRIHRQKPRQRQRGEQPQRRHDHAQPDRLRIPRAFRLGRAEQQPEHLEHRRQQRDHRHASVPRAADRPAPVAGDGGGARLFLFLPPGQLLLRLIAPGRLFVRLFFRLFFFLLRFGLEPARFRPRRLEADGLFVLRLFLHDGFCFFCGFIDGLPVFLHLCIALA